LACGLVVECVTGINGRCIVASASAGGSADFVGTVLGGDARSIGSVGAAGNNGSWRVADQIVWWGIISANESAAVSSAANIGVYVGTGEVGAISTGAQVSDSPLAASSIGVAIGLGQTRAVDRSYWSAWLIGTGSTNNTVPLACGLGVALGQSIIGSALDWR
jgi:hypothetical protein